MNDPNVAIAAKQRIEDEVKNHRPYRKPICFGY